MYGSSLAVAQHVAETLSAAWNRADGSAFGSAFTTDADFVNILGAYFCGRDAVAKQHQVIFDGVYSGSTILFTASESRELADGVLLAHIRAELQIPHGPMAGTMRTLATAVLLRSDESHWRISAFHNTQQRQS